MCHYKHSSLLPGGGGEAAEQVLSRFFLVLLNWEDKGIKFSKAKVLEFAGQPTWEEEAAYRKGAACPFSSVLHEGKLLKQGKDTPQGTE